MKNKIIIITFLSIIALNSSLAQKITRIDPPFWFSNMERKELQIMLYGNNLASYTCSVEHPKIQLISEESLVSPNYKILYLKIPQRVSSGTFPIILHKGKQKKIIHYELRKRTKKGEERMGFDASDVLYLIMPDRFANGNNENDYIPNIYPDSVNRTLPDRRHGGDLLGIEKNLDYLKKLGVTAIWLTPVLENNMKQGSYHGYATTDYYKIDPRFGSNDDYVQFINEAHKKGIKVVMDMIFNHCGLEHPWIADPPTEDWFNNPDYKNNYIQTSFKLTPQVDPYVSNYDLYKSNKGWFVPSMPDLNQCNKYVYDYLLQNSFWWIETADIDGIRMDTYPYADYDAMSRWMQELNHAYPNFNVVGETWVTQPAYTAWWQKDSKLSAPKNSHLKTVMDFSLYEAFNKIKTEDSKSFEGGLNRIYNNFVYDFLYPNPKSVLGFFENHDTDRYLEEGEDLDALKQAATILLTCPRIPQLYYGTELLLNGLKSKNDGYVRKDFPGGWDEDNTNWFNSNNWNEKQKESYHFFSTVLNWRKKNKAVTQGSMVQFIPEEGVYAFFRNYEEEKVWIIVNGNAEKVQLPTKNYNEQIQNRRKGINILNGKEILIKDKLLLQPKETMIIELYK